ncbi:MarR family winged helix-turn-helix transcriptional regulator [Mobilibacterium timonense]|uniref:MarR family winged helix-turn-helix transcriptional regulator n=1 Tax=Mobilibacterium timonense TaxID=1871012 RepID=UPI000986B125|nr:MarR family transcriptional regulator [Mobilibacterium timonense]
MNADNTKLLLDSFRDAELALTAMPELPKGVTPLYIHVLDAIAQLEEQGRNARVSDVAELLGTSLPGATRALNSMEALGLVKKEKATKDRRLVILRLCDRGREIHEQYVVRYMDALSSLLGDISDEDAECTAATIRKVAELMRRGRVNIMKD